MRVNSLLTRTMRSSVVRTATASGACSNSSFPISALPRIWGNPARGSTGSSGRAGVSGVLDCDVLIGCPPIVIAAVKLRGRTEDSMSFNRSRNPLQELSGRPRSREEGDHMLTREEWLPLARKLDWDYCYVREDEVFPEVISGRPWLPHSEWKDWEESFKTSYREYVDNQYEKDMAVYAVRDAVGRLENVQKLAVPWLNGLKVHAAALPLAEFTGVIGNLRGARFGRDSA